ncbi:tetratricopeptide repeat protein [uncultured Alistipes sp.]|uniref:tetratricopeptide repeat protein n=1 Tax=uncultured Alistipes sp. TaxID=538949 RepID=UPI0025F3019E|nr:tetratricopeptide repeat protein [uncultured Alistipes sp.]
MQKAYLNPTSDQTFEVVGEGAYNFAGVLARTREMEAAGDVEGACNERFQAFQRLAALVPEDEEINLEWNHRNSRAALELVLASAIDHFLINDFEMSAALLELLLELDPEDHLEGSELLAFDYLAMDEQELFDEVINDVSDKYASREVLLLWSAFRRDGKLPEGELQHFKTRFAPYFAEFTAGEHPADEAYLKDIGSERPSLQAQARELWLQTENLWVLWPGFIGALREAR